MCENATARYLASMRRWPATDTTALCLVGSPRPCSRALVARTFLLDAARPDHVVDARGALHASSVAVEAASVP